MEASGAYLTTAPVTGLADAQEPSPTVNLTRPLNADESVLVRERPQMEGAERSPRSPASAQSGPATAPHRDGHAHERVVEYERDEAEDTL